MEQSTSIKQAVILAGGRGTRLKPLTDSIPKPMVLMSGKPFLQYLLELLKENGIQEIIMLLGYLPEKIQEYFGDGEKFGLKICYSVGEISDESATRIKKVGELLADNFLLLYCDNYWPLRLTQLYDFHRAHKTLATVTVFSNKNKITKNNILVDGKGYVAKYDRSRQSQDLNGVEIGFFILGKEILNWLPEENVCFEEKILPALIEKRQLAGFMSDHRYYSIGSLERLPLTGKFLKPKKIIFLDRDGVINVKPPKADYVKKWNEFNFLPGSKEGLKLLRDKGYKIFILTNQPGIARGMMSEKDLSDINKNMVSELAKEGVEITKIYYCPHGWDEGCDCRKPKAGLFYRAASDYNLDLTKVICIGDDERDDIAAKDAGCRSILMPSDGNLFNIVKEAAL